MPNALAPIKQSGVAVVARTVAVAFTDGDTLRRVSVTDSDVAATSKILLSIRRPDSADDSADTGFIYLANVVRVYAGGFDALVAALDWGTDDPTENPPNETVTLTYSVAA